MSQPTADARHIVCPHCDTLNRVPRGKPAGEARCGECHRPLFTAEPLPLDGARFERHLAKSDIPLLVDFWAPWCGPCRTMAPEFERAARRLEPKARLVKINVDEEPRLAAHYDVRSIPTLALFLHGRELARTAGLLSATALVPWTERHSPSAPAG